MQVSFSFISCKCITSYQLYVNLDFVFMLNSVSLDPDEDKRDTTIFDGFKNYLLNELSADESKHFRTVTLRNLAKRAQTLKSLRPPRGINFSLQQQRKLFLKPLTIKLNAYRISNDLVCFCSLF